MKRLNIAVTGIGNRALPKQVENSNWLGWIELIKRSEEFQLTGVHDVSDVSINRIIERGYLNPDQTFRDLDIMLSSITCDAILVCNPVEYHAEAIDKALEHGLNILVEKPIVNDLEIGKKLVEAIERKGKVGAVIQNWRSKDVGLALYKSIQGGLLGKVGHIFFRYIRDRENPNYPRYIFEEEYPLLYAMGIHHLDLFKFVLEDEYESVHGFSFKPPWSLYKSNTGLNLFLKTKNKTTIIYTGTISSKNSIIPQESLIIEGEKGSLLSESQWMDPPLWFYPANKKEKIDLTEEVNRISTKDQYDISDEYILKNFYQAVVNKEKPVCSFRDGLNSVAVLEASKLACETGKTIYLDNM